jgi:CHAT domain-containing protein
MDRAKEAEALYQHAEALMKAGDYEAARSKLFEAVQLWQQAHQSERAAQALLEIGERHSRASRWQDALQCYRQLLRLQALSPRTEALAYNALAYLYRCLGQFDVARRYYQQALSFAQQVKDQSAQAKALIGLATVCAERGQLEAAREFLGQARRWTRQVGDENAEATMLHLLARIYRDQGRMAEAREVLQQALALYQKSGDQENETQSLCFLSDLYFASGQNQLALEYATEALKLANRLKLSEQQWRAWFALARAQRALGRPEEANKSYFFAFGFIEMQRLLDLSADVFRISFLAERQAVYRERASFLIECGHADEAFEVIEYARSRAALDLLAAARRNEEQPDSAEQKGELREITQRIDRVRTALRSPQLNDEQRAALQTELKEAEQRLEEARLETEMNRQKRFTRPVTLQQVQETMLRPNDVLIEFFLGEKRSYVWLISPGQTKWAALPGQKEIEETVKPYLDVIAAKPNPMHLDWEAAKQTKLAGQLFGLLLGPFAEQLTPGQRLIIAPDGLLYYLPFETLIRDGRYLIEHHEISYVPSASALGLLQQPTGRVDPTNQMELLAVGDPAFGPPLKAEVSRKQGVEPEDVLREIWSASGYRLPSLPNTRIEIQSISEFFPPEQRQVYLGASATEEAIKREPLSRYRRLHFATHSLIDERFPARSGVVLTLDDDPEEDGLLDVNEIAELKLDCDLAVLSACQTGRGQLVSGEGIVGLARAFLVAGARSVAVSLWSVSDRSTAQFMKSFYRHLTAGLSVAAALRQAKLDMLRSDAASRHPYYWAPFVVVGKAG